jgi:hypothetical protein
VLIGPGDSFIAGLFAWYVLHRHGGALVLSVLFSMPPVWLFRRSRGGAIPAAAGAASERAQRVVAGRVVPVLIPMTGVGPPEI